jgi:protease-4
MKKFLLGFVIGLLFAGLAVFILIAAAIRFGGQRPVTIPSNAALVMRMEGGLPEQSPVELPFFEQQQGLTVAETWQMLRNAAADARVKALVLEPRDLDAGWAKLEELRQDVLNFKKSGKPVYAFLRGGGTREYYIATAADRIFITPEDELDVKGLRAELVFVKNTLDKLGVKAEFEHVGKYKDAPDMFTKTGPSAETLEVINGLLDQFYGDFINKVAESRKQKPDAVRTLIDGGPFVGKEALNGGLVDGLIYEDEVFAKLKEQLKLSQLDPINSRNYARAMDGNPEGPNRVALVVGQGDIVRGEANETGGQGITSGGMIRLLRQVRDDNSIKAVILRIDSPGGDGTASDDILHEAKLLSKKKPMVISMSDLAASGGYYIAMTGDPVVAYPNTETGSIGVFFGKADLRGLYDKIGVNKTILTRGTNAAIDTDYAPLTDAQRAKLRSEIELFYQGFVQRVAEGRRRSYNQIEPLAQGRVWTGAQAKKNGLVDELGGLDRAIELVKERARIGAKETVTLVPYPPRRSVLQVLLDRGSSLASLESDLESRASDARIQSALHALIGDLPVRALSRGGLLSLMPYRINIR